MSTFPEPSSSGWIEAVGWVLVRSTWQGAVIAAALALALRSLRRSSPQARYVAACVALGLMVALPVATARRPGMASTAGSRAGLDPGPVAEEPTSRAVEPDESGPARQVPPRFGERLRPILPVVVAAWLTGVGVLWLRLLGGWALARRWAWRDARPVPEAWIGRLDRLGDRLGLRRAVTLLESARVEVPAVIGWLRPAILLPASALSGLTPAELEAILAHELAHIRRHDYAINLIQCVAETLLFYHPCARWASRAIRREREHCCDDLAVALCGDRPAYARALAAMEGLRGPAFSLLPAANGGTLLARIRRVLKPEEESSMKSARMLVALAVALAATPAWMSRVSARQEAPPPIAPAATSPNRSYADIVTHLDESSTARLDFHAAAFEQGFGAVPRAARADGPPPPGPVGGEFKLGVIEINGEVRVARRAEGVPTPIVAADCPTCLDPPGEAEVLARLPGPAKSPVLNVKVERKGVSIVVEKTGQQVDATKVFPLAGPCQLVHCHYKATVTFDEVSSADQPIPFHHTRHRVEVVFLDKDHLRRAGGSAPAAKGAGDEIDRKIEVRECKLLREYSIILRRKRRSLQKSVDVLNSEMGRLNRQLDELNRELEPLEDAIEPEAVPKTSRVDSSRYFPFAIGAFW